MATRDVLHDRPAEDAIQLGPPPPTITRGYPLVCTCLTDPLLHRRSPGQHPRNPRGFSSDHTKPSIHPIVPHSDRFTESATAPTSTCATNSDTEVALSTQAQKCRGLECSEQTDYFSAEDDTTFLLVSVQYRAIRSAKPQERTAHQCSSRPTHIAITLPGQINAPCSDAFDTQ